MKAPTSEYLYGMFHDLAGLLKRADAPAWVQVLTDEVCRKHIVAAQGQEKADAQ